VKEKIKYQVWAETRNELGDLENKEVVFESDTLPPARKEYDDLTGLYEGETHITLAMHWVKDDSSAILASKLNQCKEGEE
jgi:hypothetical protein